MTDKERLERIIQMQYDGYTIWDMGENDLVWLIEQAGRVQELEKENKRLEDFIETIQNVHFVELQREKAENRRYREVINNINEKAMLYGVDEQVFEAIKEAIRVLEGRE